MNIEIRPVDRKNLQQAIDVAIDIFGEHDRKGIELEFKASLGIVPESTAVRTELSIGDIKCFLAYKDGQPAGITGYYTIAGHEEDIWLGWVGVSSDFQRQGLGTLLINEAFSRAAQNGIRSLRIWTTLEEKYDDARKLYNKMGFVEEIYKPESRDAGKLIAVFSKAANPENHDPYLWRDTAYPMDCERYEIPYLNSQLGLAGKRPSAKFSTGGHASPLTPITLSRLNFGHP